MFYQSHEQESIIVNSKMLIWPNLIVLDLIWIFLILGHFGLEMFDDPNEISIMIGHDVKNNPK